MNGTPQLHSNTSDSCICYGNLSLTDCPLRNPNDVPGEQEPGSRILVDI
ncbi:hypothetical protein [Xenorhabdus bovienii]